MSDRPEYRYFYADGRVSDEPPEDGLILVSVPSDYKALRLEGEEALQFLEAAGSGWIREAIAPSTQGEEPK